MAAGDTTQGRRRPDGTEVHELEPGDYSVVLKDNEVRRVWLCLPSGQFGQVDGKWTVTIHADESISVSPSILDAPDGWHGYLKHGVWEEV